MQKTHCVFKIGHFPGAWGGLGIASEAGDGGDL